MDEKANELHSLVVECTVIVNTAWICFVNQAREYKP